MIMAKSRRFSYFLAWPSPGALSNAGPPPTVAGAGPPPTVAGWLDN